MIVGFTGSRQGMTDKQKDRFISLISLIEPSDFHHGDCIGADSDAHDMVVNKGIFIMIHPPIIDSLRAFKMGKKGLFAVLNPKDYIDRNKDIVDSSDILIAIPSTLDEKLRSGTWSTIRYARKQKKQVIVILPNGKVMENG